MKNVNKWTKIDTDIISSSMSTTFPKEIKQQFHTSKEVRDAASTQLHVCNVTSLALSHWPRFKGWIEMTRTMSLEQIIFLLQSRRLFHHHLTSLRLLNDTLRHFNSLIDRKCDFMLLYVVFKSFFGVHFVIFE